MNLNPQAYEVLIDRTHNKESLIDTHLPSLKNSQEIRFQILLYAALASVGYYASDNIIKSFDYLLRPLLDVSQEKYNTLYFISPEVCIVIPVLAGLLIDRFGLKNTFHWFAVFVIFGQSLLTFGVAMRSWVLCFLGRFTSSLGGASLLVARAVIIVKWFLGKELSLALAAPILILELGRFIGFYIVLWIWGWSSELFGLLTAVMGCCLSWYAVFYLLDLDEMATQEEVVAGGRKEIQPCDFKLQDLRQLRQIYYLTSGLILISSVIYIGFVYNPIEVFGRFGYDAESLEFLITLLAAWIPAVCAPLFGYLIDKRGGRSKIFLIGLGVFLVSNLLVTFLPDQTPKLIITCLVIVFLLAYGVQLAVAWPCIALLVPEKVTGTAFGITYTFVHFITWIWLIIDPATKFGVVWNGILISIAIWLALLLLYFIRLEDAKIRSQLDNPTTHRRKLLIIEGRQ